jgi:hypothetical protein
MSAYYPSQQEIEKEYQAKSQSVSPSTILLARHDLLSVKRENFKYALRKTLPAFFDLLKNLKYDGFPVQDPPLVIGGGVAVSIISGTALDTPDLDVELSGFRLDTAGGNANASVILAAGSNSGTLFSKYCHSLFEQIRGFIAGNPAMFSAYGEIIEEERNHDIEVRNGQIRGEKVANIWLSMIYNEGFFSKIVILAKIGEFVETINGAEKHAPYIERILEIKLPKKIFTPLPVGEALIHKEDIGLWFASREKMLPDIRKSFGDKCGALSRLAKDYDTRIFPNVLAHDGYFDLIEEPQKREEIINYKVRIITLRERLRILGLDAESISICSPFLTLAVIPFTTDAEKTDAAEEARIAEAAAQAEAARLAEEERRLEEEKKAKREAKKARVAAEKAAAEQAAAAKAAEIEAAKAAAAEEAARAARAKAEEERQQSEKIRKAQAEKKAKKAAKATAQVERASPTLSESSSTGSAGGGAEEVAGPVAAGAGPLEPKEIIKNNGFIYFTEGFSTDPTSILNDLYTTLQINFPIAGIPEPPVLLLELNSTDRYRLAERAPLHSKIIHIMDDDSLNQAETIACKIIPDLFLLNTIDQKDIKSTLWDIAHHLTISTWDIQDTQLRKKITTSLSLWSGQVASMRDFKRENMLSSFRFLLKTSVEIFDILCQQVDRQKRSNYTVDDYNNKDLLSVHKGIDSLLSQMDPKRFTATIPAQSVVDLRNQFEGLYCQTKVKNLLFTLDAAYPAYAAVIDKRLLLKPVLLIAHSSYLSLPMINLIQQFCTKAGIQKIAGTFSRTSEFLGIGEMAKTPCQASLLAQLYEKLRGGHEERGLNLEITLQKSRHLWFGNTAILNEVCQLVTLLLQRNKFIICNREHFWQRFSVNTEPIAAFLAPYERFIEEQSMDREEKLDERFIDAEFAAKQKLVLEQEEIQKAKQKEAVNKEIEQRIQTLVELGMTVDEAALQVAQNMEEAEGGPSAAGGGGSRKAGKGKGGKGGKRTRKNLRYHLAQR